MTYYTYREAAARLRCSEKTLYNRVRDGLIQPLRNGRLVLFTDDCIDGFLGNEREKDYWDLDVINCPVPGE